MRCASASASASFLVVAPRLIESHSSPLGSEPVLHAHLLVNEKRIIFPAIQVLGWRPRSDRWWGFGWLSPAQNLVWGFFCQGVSGGRLICFPSSVFLFDLEARFLVPTRASLTSARAGAVKVRRRTNLAACATLARPHLEGFEHDRTLEAVGMTIRGKPAFGRDHSRRNLVFGGSRRPEP